MGLNAWAPAGYRSRMTDQGTQGQNQDRDNVDYEDQDAEPSLKAPGDAGPTGVVADE